MHLVKQRTRLKNQVHGILSRNLVPTCPHSKLSSGVGRRWLARQIVPADEQRSIDALLRQLDFLDEELAEVERDIALDSLDDPVIARLMTVPRINVTVAMSMVAAVGDFSRFESPDRLVSYLGLNPQLSQSGNSAAKHGRITKLGRAQARGHDCRGGILRVASPRPTASVLSAHQRPSRLPGRDSRDSSQDDGAVLASGHQRTGLRVRSPKSGRSQATIT